MTALPQLITWFLENVDLPPTRLHLRGVERAERDHLPPQPCRSNEGKPCLVCAEKDKALGSKLGTPRATGGFLGWMHVYARDWEEHRYRYPMRRAIDKTNKHVSRKGYPSAASVLWRIALEGSVIADPGYVLGQTVERVMASGMERDIAVGWIAHVLRECFDVYREDFDAKVLPKVIQRMGISDSEANAGAEGRKAA